jgi:ferredoxin-NADP reductase
MPFESKILSIIQRTPDVKSFRFYRPSFFHFKAGQCLLISLTINKKETKKYYSISSSPTQKEYLEFTQKITTTEFSNALNNLKAGDLATLDGPYGSFTFEGEFLKVAMLAGGVGVTPCTSMIKYCIDKKIETDIVLLFSNRTETDILFRKEFDHINKQNPNIKIIYTLTRADKKWIGHSRRIDKQMVLETIRDFKERVFFLCGPPIFVSSMENILHNLKIKEENIKKENF